MKFTNGNWLNREGVAIHAPVVAYETLMDRDAVVVHAPCKPIEHRGSTLDGPLLTLRFSSPMENVIRVQVHHFVGEQEKYPRFAVADHGPNVVIRDADEAVSLTTGDLTVSIQKAKWSFEFSNRSGKLTNSGWRALAYITEQFGTRDETLSGGAGLKSYMREQLNLGVGECVYGLGERFTPFVKNGQVVDIWNKDGGTSSEQAYKSIPFYVTNRGYGVFVNHPENVSFEVGSERVSRVQFSVEGEYLDYYIINGPTMKEVLQRYTALTGKPALPPAWSFGLWLTTSFTTQYDEWTVNHFVDGMLDRNIPLRVFHYDCFWMKEFEWCNFEWDTRMFPDPAGMLKRLKEKGLNISVWINPYIAQKSKLFREAADNGYLIRRQNGDVWQWDLWQAGMGIVDFTNPDACEWFASKLRALMDMGVDCFKTDFGERIPTDVVYHDGSDPMKMHNYYTFLYNKVVFETLQSGRADHDAVLFARSATAGSQQFPVHWGGDCSANYESMAETLRGGLSLSLSGFGFWSHDIGGFEDASTPDLYKRWVAFGLLSSHSRLHGSSSYRVPWIYDEESVDVLRHFTRLKYQLMPYLYGVGAMAKELGLPVMRPMVLEFPDDPTCAYLDRQYMLGPSLLVAPIFNEQGQSLCYLPEAEGPWTHLLSGTQVAGGRWQREVYDYMSLPLFVRPGSIIAIGNTTDAPDYDYTDGVEFHVFECPDGANLATLVHDLTGNVAIEARVTRTWGEMTIEVKRARKPWSVVLRNVMAVSNVTNGEARATDQGVRITPSDIGGVVRIVL